jgi:hypothetical protein
MKVWIVTENYWESTTIIRVCDSKEKAIDVAKFQLDKIKKDLGTGKILTYEIQDVGESVNLFYPLSESKPDYEVEEWDVY